MEEYIIKSVELIKDLDHGNFLSRRVRGVAPKEAAVERLGRSLNQSGSSGGANGWSNSE